MKTALQLKLGQQLTMTPQLQQAIRLLQLSTLDLQAELQEALITNPMLELQQDNAASTEQKNNSDTEQSAADVTTQSTDSTTESIPEELPVDGTWDDIYPNTTSSYNAVATDFDYLANNDEVRSLQDHLRDQIHLLPLSDTDLMIAFALIDSIADDGYLRCDLLEVQDSLNAQQEATTETHEDTAIEYDEIEAMLHQIQQLEPAGVGARDLQECLVLQLQQSPIDIKGRQIALTIMTQHLTLLAKHDTAQLKRRLKIDDAALDTAIKLIQSLDPHPGNQLSPSPHHYIVPDVIVRNHQDQWQVELNHDAIPKLRINTSYAGLVKRADNSDDNHFLRDQLQEARWLLKSVESRNETLLNVARCIVKYQNGFFNYGEEAMKPLVLHDIAKAVDMHESTVSRVTTQKYMHTPRGIFELKYFFSSHVSTREGGECSSTAIRALIKKLIAAENPQKPLSDNKIAALLAEQHINVARRTIAKYRESMQIASSSERKRLHWQDKT